MEPTLNPGDFLVGARVGRLRRGTLAVIEHPERPGYQMIKRVVALPGERIGDHELGRDQYWVEGDRRSASTDSRSFGAVDGTAIQGRVLFRYWPPGRIGVVR